jgi:hypothetical protein
MLFLGPEVVAQPDEFFHGQCLRTAVMVDSGGRERIQDTFHGQFELAAGQGIFQIFSTLTEGRFYHCEEKFLVIRGKGGRAAEHDFDDF